MPFDVAGLSSTRAPARDRSGYLSPWKACPFLVTCTEASCLPRAAGTYNGSNQVLSNPMMWFKTLPWKSRRRLNKEKSISIVSRIGNECGGEENESRWRGKRTYVCCNSNKISNCCSGRASSRCLRKPTVQRFPETEIVPEQLSVISSMKPLKPDGRGQESQLMPTCVYAVQALFWTTIILTETSNVGDPSKVPDTLAIGRAMLVRTWHS